MLYTLCTMYSVLSCVPFDTLMLSQIEQCKFRKQENPGNSNHNIWPFDWLPDGFAHSKNDHVFHFSTRLHKYFTWHGAYIAICVDNMPSSTCLKIGWGSNPFWRWEVSRVALLAPCIFPYFSVWTHLCPLNISVRMQVCKLRHVTRLIC